MIAIILAWLRKITRYGSNSCNNVVHAIYATDVTGNCSGRRNRCPILPSIRLGRLKKERRKKNYFFFATAIRAETGNRTLDFSSIENVIPKYPFLVCFQRMEQHQILFVQIKIQLLYDCLSMHRRTENEFFPRKRFHYSRGNLAKRWNIET